MQQSKAVADLIDQGLAAQQNGDTPTARQHYEAALQLSADDPEALHLLGLVHEQENDRPGAIALIERAIAVDPQEPIFRLNLSAILEKNRQFDLAAEHVRATVKAKPNSSDLSTRLGDIELHRNDAEKAAAAYRRAYELDQQNAAALAGYGRAMLLMKNIIEAKRAMNAVMRVAPGEVGGLELGIRVGAFEGDGKIISQFAARWKTERATDKESLTTLSKLLFDLSYTNEACNAYKLVTELDPNSEETLVAYARYCTAAQRFDDSGVALSKALKINPQSTTGLFALSRLNYFMGDLETAEQLCLQVTKADPRFSLALTQLCNLRNGDMSDEHIEAMKALAADQSTPPDQIYELYLSLGKIYDRRDNFDEAFSNMQRGNEIGESHVRASGGGFDHLQCAREADGAISFFDRPIEVQQFKPAPHTPIFVVGMPRSGTTLTESILAAHPDTFSIGELSSLPEVHRIAMAWAAQTGAKSISDAPLERLQSWRDLYFSYFPDHNSEKYLVDKQPINFRFAGLIRAIFPEGKIIHLRREPIETGFSIFRHPFDRQWPFSYKLEHIAHYYGEYARLTAHWEKTLGADFPLFQYENLIEDFENEVRRLLAHCGLDWHEGCLSFHQAKRPIATFSSVQARQPASKKPKRAAQKYAAYLTPLSDGLATANVDIETGALVES